MKKMKTFCLLFVAFLCLALLTVPKANAATEGIFTYSVSGGKATVTGCTAPIGEITIPDTLGGYPVTRIGHEAFSGCRSLTAVTIPDSVTTIGEEAFSGCTGLTSVTIPDSVTTIGNDAFYDCTGLTSITIPDSVTIIGVFAFYGCTGLTTVTITDPSAWCKISFSNTSSANPLYYADTLNILDENGNPVTEVVLDSTVKVIPSFAFSASNITSVTIGGSVTAIGNAAFDGCTGLTSVTIPDTVTTIGNFAFSGCTGLTSVTIPDSVTTIDDWAFSFCTSLTSVTIPDSVTTIGDFAFKGCTGLTSINFPDSVTTIGDSAFEGCTGLITVMIPKGVTEIGGGMFENCTSLCSVIIPDGVTFIGYSAFANCKSLTTIVIPDSVTEIQGVAWDDFGGAFINCNNLESVTIGKGVKRIGETSFSNCAKLKNVYYTGTQAQWKEISIDSGNTCLTNANIHYDHIHDYTLFPTEVVAPTCTEMGYTLYTCIYGETMKGDWTNALGHEAGEMINKVEATCTEDGYTVYVCSRCGETFNGDLVNALGHDFTGEVKTIEATCTADGHKGASCIACDEIRKDEIIPATGHKAVLVPLCDPTCTEKGVSKVGTQCQNCKIYILEPVWIPALGHSYGEYVSNNDATYFEDGTKTAVCATCGDVDTVTDEGSRLIPEGNVILRQPVSVNAESGENVTFFVEAFGQIVSYQWQYRQFYKWINTNFAGYNTDTLTVPATGARNGYDYRCIVTFADGTELTSKPAELTVHTTITVTKNPNDQFVALGDKGQFTAAATGEQLKYQWQYCRPGTTKWIDTAMEGAKKPTVYIETTTARDGYMYRCMFTDVAGKVSYSEPATMTVLSYKSHPRETFAAPTDTVQFTVQVNVEEGFTYQWEYSKNNGATWSATGLTGNKTATLTVPAQNKNGYRYRCVITGTQRSKLYSKAAVLHVSDPVVITEQPQNTVSNVGLVATFKVVATNAYKYQWYYQYATDNTTWRKTSADGNANDTLNVTVKKNNNGYKYRCEITGMDGRTYYTEAATLTVVEPPHLEVVANPADRTVDAESVVKFGAMVDGEVIAYQWQYTADGETWHTAPFDGADTNLLVVVASPEYNGCQFRCVITGLYGVQITTTAATLTIQ